MYEGALASVRDVGPANTVQYAMAGAGHVSLLLGEFADRAAALFAESHEVARRLGAEGNPRAAVGQGMLARERGDLAARGSTSPGRGVAGRADRTGVDRRRPGRPRAPRRGRRRPDSAEFFHRRAWQTAPGHAAALEGLACLAVARGGGADAARLLGAAAAWRRKRHRPASRLERADAERAARGARAVLGDGDFDAAYRAARPGPTPSSTTPTTCPRTADRVPCSVVWSLDCGTGHSVVAAGVPVKPPAAGEACGLRWGLVGEYDSGPA